MSERQEIVKELCRVYGITDLQNEVYEKLQQSGNKELVSLGFNLRSMLDRQVYMIHEREEMAEHWHTLHEDVEWARKQGQVWKEAYLGAKESLYEKAMQRVRLLEKQLEDR